MEDDRNRHMCDDCVFWEDDCCLHPNHKWNIGWYSMATAGRCDGYFRDSRSICEKHGVYMSQFGCDSCAFDEYAESVLGWSLYPVVLQK